MSLEGERKVYKHLFITLLPSTSWLFWKQHLCLINLKRKKRIVNDKTQQRDASWRPEITTESLSELICGEPCEEVSRGQRNMRLDH